MTASEALKIVAVLKATYVREPFTEERVRIYASMLTDLDYGAVDGLVGVLIATRNKCPMPADIRRTVAERELGLPTSAAAWGEVEGQIRAANSHPGGLWEPYVPTWSNPVLKRVVDFMRFWRIEGSSNLSVERGQFLRLYAEEREAAIVGRCSRALLPHPEADHRHGLPRLVWGSRDD